jgi:ATP-dependent RNA helicase CshB
LPILNNIDLEYKEVQALIVLPTKELARQVFSKLEEFKKNEPLLKTLLLVGNEDQKRQIDKLKCSKPQIVVGTIGKVHEFVKNKLITKKIKTFVLDEVDMLFDLGFKKIVDELFSAIDSNNLQKIVCSATAHESFAGQLKKHLKNTKVFSTSSSI